MAATGEVEKTVAVQSQSEDPAPAKPAAKAAKEKKPKAPKEKKTAKAPKEKKPAPKTAAHPPYFEMIKEAIMALKEKGGSSPYAIAKFMEDKHKAVLPANFRKILGLQLKNSATKGKLIKIKASYKLSDVKKAVGAAAAAKKPVKKATTEKKRKAPPAASATAPAKPKKPVVKKAGAGTKKAAKKVKKPAAALKPKQPKSIRSPAKRARKAAAA